MAIELHVHLEATNDPESPCVWWAECDEVPGFSAAASHLAELVARSEAALADLLGQEIDVAPTMVPNDEPIEAPSITLTGDLSPGTLGSAQETVWVPLPVKIQVPT